MAGTFQDPIAQEQLEFAYHSFLLSLKFQPTHLQHATYRYRKQYFSCLEVVDEYNITIMYPRLLYISIPSTKVRTKLSHE